MGAGGPQGGVKNVSVQRFRVGGDGYDSPVDEDDEGMAIDGAEGNIRETFDVTFNVAFGPMTGEWVVKSLALDVAEGVDSGGNGSAEATTGAVSGNIGAAGRGDAQTTAVCWKTKFLEAQQRLWEKEEEVRGLRDKVLEAVL